MKTFLSNIILFFIAFIILDKLSGVGFDYLNSHAKGGDTAHQYYICKQSNDDILILGSSRANHHYVSSIIEDSLRMSCYNCGADGNGIFLHYGRYKLITERYTPKLIIYDLVTAFDIEANDNLKYLEQLKQYAYTPSIRELFNSISTTEKYKLQSKIYQYNTKFIQMIGDNINPQQTSFKGYKPIYNTMNYEPKILHDTNNNIKIDSLKLKYLEYLIKDTQQKGIKLIFMISPQYKAKSSLAYEPAKRIIRKYNIPIFDFLTNPHISYNKKFFSDPFHLNNNGAEAYTKEILKVLQKID